MMLFYKLLLFIHIVAAIVGMGPSFVMTRVIAKIETMSELKQGFKARNKIHVFIIVGGTTLLLTGLIMGIMRPMLFTQFWYVGSLIIYLVILASGPLILAPTMKPIKELIQHHQGEQIPASYYPLAKRLSIVERMTNVLIAIIIILMIAKPF